MRKLIYHVAMTLDGFIAHQDGSIGGFLEEGDFIADFLETINTYGAVLMGRNTYEFGYEYGLQKGQPAYAQINPELTNYIFSTSLHFEQNERIQIVSEAAAGFVKKLKAQEGKPLWLCGGGAFAGNMLENELIDELVIKLNPVVFGKGIPLFGSIHKQIRLELNHTKTYSNGLMLVSYGLRYGPF